jgi:hypothetical protein
LQAPSDFGSVLIWISFSPNWLSKGAFAFPHLFPNMHSIHESEMFIRNKGTKVRPKYFVVENYRIPGREHPRQRTIFNLGKNPSIDDAISFYSDMAKLAHKEPQNPIFKDNKPLGSLARIKYLLKKLKDLKFRMETNIRARGIDDEITGIKQQHRPLGKSVKLRLKILELNKMICKCLRDENISQWDTDTRRTIKKILKESVDFRKDL